MKTSIIVVALLAAVSLGYAADRASLINAAIQEVKAEHATVQSSKGKGAKTAGDLLRAFKRASTEAMEEGAKRVKFEKLLHKAERSILEAERKEAKSQSKFAQAESIAEILVHKAGSVLTKEEVARIYQESGECMEEPIDCTNMQDVRTVSGVCNNLANPTFGAAGSQFRRLLQPQYEDGLSQLRGTMQSEGNSVVGEGPFAPPNPSARLISVEVVTDQPLQNADKTHLIMQWGQFMDHDLDLAPAFNNITCGCPITPECVAIRVPSGDPTFSTCHPFPRSLPVCDPEAANGVVTPREQRNELTAFMDGSQIYGSTEEVFEAVREGNTAFLRTGPNIPASGGPSLPIDEHEEGEPELVECMTEGNCFLAGDVRVNEHLALTVMHTIWVREHNRIARDLQQINPTWTDEQVFQTARAIVGAEIQKITLKDYLPLLIGDLLPEYTGYKPDVNPSIPNAFATAAFRFGHSQIDPFFTRLDASNEPLPIGPLSLLDSFFDPTQYAASGGTDPILRGLLTKPARSVDEFVNSVLTNQLFEQTAGTSMDLAALNIQRGRDHGLPPYLTWKRWAARPDVCGISTDIENDLTLVRLLRTYGTLETVDLWVGGLAETNVPGGILGATFACIFAKTFEAIRDGDRFYYESPTSGFTPQQMQEIEKASLSRVICDNSDGITQVQRNAFRGDQEQIDCSLIDGIDLSAWGPGGTDGGDRQCFVRVEVNSQEPSREVAAVSRNNGQRERFDDILDNGETTTCLPFLCPTDEDPTTRIAVFVRGRPQCMGISNIGGSQTRRRHLLRRVRENDITDPNSGLYSSLQACASGFVDGVTFTCGSDIASVESDGALLKDLEDTLSEVAHKQTSTDVFEVSVDDKLPEDVDEYINGDGKTSTKTQSSNGPWKEKTINVLEGLLESLKAEEQVTSEEKEATDQDLYDNLAKLLKNIKK